MVKSLLNAIFSSLAKKYPTMFTSNEGEIHFMAIVGMKTLIQKEISQKMKKNLVGSKLILDEKTQN